MNHALGAFAWKRGSKEVKQTTMNQLIPELLPEHLVQHFLGCRLRSQERLTLIWDDPDWCQILRSYRPQLLKMIQQVFPEVRSLHFSSKNASEPLEGSAGR